MQLVRPDRAPLKIGHGRLDPTHAVRRRDHAMGGAPDIDLYTVEWGVPASIVASLLVIAAAAQQAWLGIIGRHDRAE